MPLNLNSPFAELTTTSELSELSKSLSTVVDALDGCISETLESLWGDTCSPSDLLLFKSTFFDASCQELDSWICWSCLTVVCWLERSWITSERGIDSVQKGSNYCKKISVCLSVMPMFIVTRRDLNCSGLRMPSLSLSCARKSLIKLFRKLSCSCN